MAIVDGMHVFLGSNEDETVRIGKVRQFLKYPTQHEEDFRFSGSVDDLLLEYDIASEKFISSSISELNTVSCSLMYVVNEENTRVSVDSGSQLYIKDSGWVDIEDVVVGMKVLTYSGIDDIMTSKINTIHSESVSRLATQINPATQDSYFVASDPGIPFYYVREKGTS